MTDPPTMKQGGVAVLERGGWLVFYPPFHCLCCGREISEAQFRFSALCGRCDMGACQVKETYMEDEASDHDHPVWWIPLPQFGYRGPREPLMKRRAEIWEKFSEAHSA